MNRALWLKIIRAAFIVAGGLAGVALACYVTFCLALAGWVWTSCWIFKDQNACNVLASI